MPGPNSAPNGDRSLVSDSQKRHDLQKKNQLRTGKTQAVREKRGGKP